MNRPPLPAKGIGNCPINRRCYAGRDPHSCRPGRSPVRTTGEPVSSPVKLTVVPSAPANRPPS